MPVESILVYTDGEVIGDGILSLSFAQSLKTAAPGTKLTWASNSASVFTTALKEMAQAVIDEHLIVPTRVIPWRELVKSPDFFHGRRFDAILDPQSNVKRTLWLKRIRHRRFISFAANQLFSSERSPETPATHVFDRLLQLGSLGLGKPLSAQPVILPSGNWRQEAMRLLPEGMRYVGFIVGAGQPQKCWPLEQFTAVAQQAMVKGDAPVFFLGPQEQDKLAAIRTALPQALFPLNDTENPSPYLTIALGERLSAAVANDSGGGHLLAAGGTPLVSLFRSASVRSKFLPRTPYVMALAPEDFNVATMQEIPYEAVKTALDSLLVNNDTGIG